MERKRRKSNDEEDHAHYLTFSCYRRLKLLESESAKKVFLECLERSRERLGFEVWGYVVMPEHAHLLVYPGDSGATVAQMLQSIKQPVSRRLRHRLTHEPKFWQPGGGYDRNIWSDKAIYKVLEYVHNNPVERGLVATPEEYAWSSARWYHEREGVFAVDVWVP